MKVLELYSGIGGMHLALKESDLEYNVVASIEINNAANEIYKLNFPNTPLYNLNIEGLTPEFVNKLNPDTILMSPPCQPFTRNGLQNDVKDPRTASFIHVLKLLEHVNVERILIENVKGFEKSEMREILVDTLKKNGFEYQEFILSPHQIGVPNSRHRYYCIAKKQPGFSFEAGPLKVDFIKSPTKECFSIGSILEENVDKQYFLSDKILSKYYGVLDISYKQSTRSCCFTKAYSRFIEGTGSVVTDKNENEVVEVFEKLKTLDSDATKLELLRSLNLRFFTPKEVCRLMSFPDDFVFPASISNRKKYMVLGNSINVKVVSELIKTLNT
ncbi:unnamed protein product [Phyllotreta striolata]|uniref:DNA methyltransferase 2 n=1 Tax=Phyllotreta striolata TaxID=444603 RepID=A0A9N9TU57_PHYSR|nr:unnamed protein product [Phyllotreta striolata]